MVSHTVCTSAQGAEKYFADHLRTGDYFAAQEPGRFHGKLAEQLGVAGQEITAESFRAFVSGDVPSLAGNDQLKRPRESSVKYQEFTYTAPKAFSVAAALDDRLKAELMAAVKEEMTWLECFASVRDRRGNLVTTETTRQTGNMIAALFPHETSRTNDPNFHIHGLIGNMSFDADRGQVLALHFGEMMKLRKTLDARIHNNLAARCMSLGYGVEVAEHGFALREVSREAMELFSERSRQVVTAEKLLRAGYSVEQLQAAAQALGNQRGEVFIDEPRLRAQLVGSLPLNRGKVRDAHVIHSEAVLVTRPSKEQISAESLRLDVASRLAAVGISVKIPSPPPPGNSPALPAPDHEAIMAKVIEQAVHKVFERESVVRLDELAGEAVRLAPGVVTNAEMTSAIRNDQRFVIGKLSGVKMITCQEIIAEERELLARVSAGLGSMPPLNRNGSYILPQQLNATPAALDAMLAAASAKGEELNRDQAATWFRQFAAIHRYVTTSSDQFLNIRGGAGTGKTHCLGLLVEESLKAGRQVFLTAPYGEQARVTMRAEASNLEKAGKTQVAATFRAANTVDHFLHRAKSPHFASQLRGADVYVDEAGLLDTTKALALVRLAHERGARIIFQGDTEQMAAVGRGSPIKLLQERLRLGMDVERANISRRQLKAEDKHLAVELSSGDSNRFASALNTLINRGDVATVDGHEIITAAAKKIHAAQRDGANQLVVSSVHRIARAVSDQIHELRIAEQPDLARVWIASLESKDLAPAELRSSQFYNPGDVVDIERKTGNVIQAQVVSASAETLRVRINGRLRSVDYNDVRDVFTRSEIERAVGAELLLTAKIKQGSHTFENKSVQTLERIEGDTLVFASGLRLDRSDGRLAQADVLTAYKAQGAKADSVLVIEDNRSLTAMANREAMHVLFTRHVQSVEMLVESHDVLLETAQRTQGTIGALDFVSAIAIPPPLPTLRKTEPPQLPSAVLLQEAFQVVGTKVLLEIQNSPATSIDYQSLERIAALQQQHQLQQTRSYRR